MLDIRTKPAFAQSDRAAGRMLAEDFAGHAATASLFVLAFRQHDDGAVQPNLKDIIILRQRLITWADFEVRPEAADAGGDHLAAFRLNAHVPWHGQQL